jgi:hypothetical protein
MMVGGCLEKRLGRKRSRADSILCRGEAPPSFMIAEHLGCFRVQQLRFLAHTGPRPDPPSPLGLDGVHERIVTAEFFPDIVIEAAVFSLNLRFGQHAFAIPREIGDKFGVVNEDGIGTEAGAGNYPYYSRHHVLPGPGSKAEAAKPWEG